MKKISVFLFLIFLSNFAFANAGVPLWGFTTSVLLCLSSILAMEISPIITLLFFIIVVLIETCVIKIILKNIKFLRAFTITCWVNFISTIVGIILLFLPLPFINKCGESCFWGGPWAFWGLFSWIFYNVLCFYLSYLIEYKVAQKRLLNDYDLKKIKKSFLWANIISYSFTFLLFVLFILYLVAIARGWI